MSLGFFHQVLQDNGPYVAHVDSLAGFNMRKENQALLLYQWNVLWQQKHN